ncbi:hypothetical protein C0992_008251 [Termitomyces sp. T32_za158]|nr:hypothetical protein C0992_008251 [Termitomyces sp. T32_za158]
MSQINDKNNSSQPSKPDGSEISNIAAGHGTDANINQGQAANPLTSSKPQTNFLDTSYLPPTPASSGFSPITGYSQNYLPHTYISSPHGLFRPPRSPFPPPGLPPIPRTLQSSDHLLSNQPNGHTVTSFSHRSRAPAPNFTLPPSFGANIVQYSLPPYVPPPAPRSPNSESDAMPELSELSAKVNRKKRVKTPTSDAETVQKDQKKKKRTEDDKILPKSSKKAPAMAAKGKATAKSKAKVSKG